MNDLSITSVGVTILPGKTGPQMKNPGDVTFIVKYPEDYKGVKYMPEGPIVTSKESADEFVKRGIGFIETPVVEEVKAEVSEEKAPVVAPTIDYNKLNKGKLQELCNERSIEYTDDLTRAELIELLVANDGKEKS